MDYVKEFTNTFGNGFKAFMVLAALITSVVLGAASRSGSNLLLRFYIPIQIEGGLLIVAGVVLSEAIFSLAVFKKANRKEGFWSTKLSSILVGFCFAGFSWMVGVVTFATFNIIVWIEQTLSGQYLYPSVFLTLFFVANYAWWVAAKPKNKTKKR